MSQATDQYRATVRMYEVAQQRIAELEAWIKQEGIQNDTCTKHILKSVCDNCQCGKAMKKPPREVA